MGRSMYRDPASAGGGSRLQVRTSELDLQLYIYYIDIGYTNI